MHNILSLDFINNEIIAIAQENGFKINAKDIINYINESSFSKGKLNDESLLEEVVGGKMTNKFIASGLILLMSLTGISGPVNAAKNGNSVNVSVSQSQNEKSIKTVKGVSNNILSNAEKEYYQRQLGSDYKIINTQGMSGAYATAYNLEDNYGNQFI